MTNKNLFLFTINFPYAKEEIFLYEEIKVLATQFNKVYVLPIDFTHKEIVFNLPLNIHIHNFNVYKAYNRIKTFIKNIRLIIKIFLQELIIGQNRILHLKYFAKNINFLLHKINTADNLHNYFKEKNIQPEIAYTYWFKNWTIILSILKLKYNYSFKLYTRIHGVDVYRNNYNIKNNFYPFRQFQFLQLTKIIAVSNHGKNYIIEDSKLTEKKVVVSKLGTQDFGISKQTNNNQYTIVSCGGLQKIKRIHLIADILMHCVNTIHWIHFGDGEENLLLSNKAKKMPANISFTHKGQVDNIEILNFYKKNTIDLFINVSTTEGLPVSIMEAISFGIPVIATNVGGVSEIINENNGWLIKKEFKVIEIATIINKYLNETEINKNILRENARKFWENNHVSTKNYTNLVNILLDK